MWPLSGNLTSENPGTVTASANGRGYVVVGGSEGDREVAIAAVRQPIGGYRG